MGASGIVLLCGVAALLLLAYVWLRARNVRRRLDAISAEARARYPVEFHGTVDRDRALLLIRHVGSEPVRDVRLWWHTDLDGEPRARLDHCAPDEVIELPFDARGHGYRWHDDEGEAEDAYVRLRVRLECLRLDGGTELNSWDDVFAEVPGDPASATPMVRRHRPPT